ncbi:MAG TPA: N-acetyltransferase, partial [Candidatus Butyricicoccus avicola]|nr:N-acetyltransferase [Candidatus Butyricicoccus avicola]
IGHILFSRVDIGGQAALALAPLAVLPAFQHQGVGSALVQAGHRIAASLGYSYAVVLGSETYYPRFGYRPAGAFGIAAPFAAPPENFMAIRLRDDAPAVHGVVRYDPAFGI